MNYGSGISAAGAAGAGVGVSAMSGTSMLGWMIIGSVVAITAAVTALRVYAILHK
jgi:hypothetical protein